MFKKVLSAKKSNTSIRNRLNLYFSILVILILSVLILILGVNGVFSFYDKELESVLNSQLENSCYKIQEEMDVLAANSIALSEEITENVTSVLLEEGKNFDDLKDNPQLIYEIENRLYPNLNTTLKSSQCSGVFAILDTTINSNILNAENSKSGLYLRFVNLNAENPVHQSVVMFRGIADIARNENVELHNRWDLEFDSQNLTFYNDMIATNSNKLSESYIYCNRLKLTETWEEISLLSVPIFDNYGNVIGICGTELSKIYFKTNLPATESSYGKIMTILSPIEDDKIFVEDGMVGTTANVGIETLDFLTVEKGKHFNRYTSENENYIGIHEVINLPSENGKDFAVLTLIPESGYKLYVRKHNFLWILGSILFFLFSLVLVFLFSKKFVEPIKNSLKNLTETELSQCQQSGIQEFDELISVLQKKSQQDNNIPQEKNLPKNMDDLIVDFTKRVETLTPAEQSIFQYYIDGYDLKEIAELNFISISTAKKHNTNINKKLKTSSKEELMLYIELFRRCDCLDRISSKN